MFPVIFVSLGPGDPELITVKGLKDLQTADCIFCPETLAKDGNRVSRAADILLQLDIPENTVHRFPIPMSKQREKALSAYDEVYMESSTLRQQGKKVCIVAEGDAGFYSSIHYVYDKLQADGIPVKHIPGIPAFSAGIIVSAAFFDGWNQDTGAGKDGVVETWGCGSSGQTDASVRSVAARCGAY